VVFGNIVRDILLFQVMFLTNVSDISSYSDVSYSCEGYLTLARDVRTLVIDSLGIVSDVSYSYK
jgi:hypothetical protein